MYFVTNLLKLCVYLILYINFVIFISTNGILDNKDIIKHFKINIKNNLFFILFNLI